MSEDIEWERRDGWQSTTGEIHVLGSYGDHQGPGCSARWVLGEQVAGGVLGKDVTCDRCRENLGLEPLGPGNPS